MSEDFYDTLLRCGLYFGAVFQLICIAAVVIIPDNSTAGNSDSKKSEAEAHRFLKEAYGGAALNERSCHEWFQRFKNGDFDVRVKEHRGRTKVYEDAELEALLIENSWQTQKELALTLGDLDASEDEISDHSSPLASPRKPHVHHRTRKPDKKKRR